MTPTCSCACSGPICFFDRERGERLWYPGDPICKHRGFPIAALQRRIVRAGISPENCFTGSILALNIPVTKTLKGIDPDKPRVKALKAWARKHKPIFDSSVRSDLLTPYAIVHETGILEKRSGK